MTEEDMKNKSLLIEEAARAILTAFGRDPETEPSIQKTPERFREFMLEEWDGWNPLEFLSGVSTENYDELIMVKNVEFMSLCEHHLLPFWGKAHVGYISNGKSQVGLSKLARVVRHFAAAPNMQERLTQNVCHFIDEQLDPKGTMVVIEASHFCMQARGVQAIGSSTVTSSVKGVFLTNPVSRQEFLSLVTL